MLEVKKLILPNWTKGLPNKTNITSKEIASFFGYKSVVSVFDLIKKGGLPPHDFLCATARGGNSRVKTKTYFWSLGLLREVEAKQNNGE
jgi:hypothetical protein